MSQIHTEDGVNSTADAATATRSERRFERLLPVSAFGLFVMGLVVALHFAEPLLMPVFAALIFSLVLSPVVQRLTKFGLPRSAASAFVVILTIAVTTTGGYYLSEPVTQWAEATPKLFPTLKYKLQKLKEPVEKLKKASEDVENLAKVESNDDAQMVEIKTPSLHEHIFGGLRDLLSKSVIIFGLLYFLLSNGENMIASIVKSIPNITDKKRVIEVIVDCQKTVSGYLLAITLINFCLGCVVGAAMAVLGMPNPILWGVVAALLNFIPYVGAILGLAVVSAVALLTFDGLTGVSLVAGSYLLVTILEGQIITPTVLGKRFTMNPLVIFLSVIFWGWLWGIPGLLMAIPILLAAREIFGRSEKLAPLATLLGSRAA